MPVTRSAKSGSLSTAGASAQPSDTPLVKGESLTGPTLSVLEDLEDDTLLRGRDVKVLRDATTTAITQVWNDTCATAALLTRQINEGNAALTEKLNESFASVGRRLDGLPAVAMLQPESPTTRITPFSGASENGVQFSIWLRRLEDVMRMRPVALTDEQRANFLIGHLEGVAREKVEELDESAKRVYGSVVSHLVAFFESPQQRYVARQKLSACRQEPGEPCTAFANRILNLVRAATSGQDPTTQKERVLEEFVARLRGDIRYFVKLDSPSSFEQAVTKAQTVEQLLSEATADRLLHPTTTLAPVQVLTRHSNRGDPPAAPKRAQLRPRLGQQRPSPSRRAPSPQVLRPASGEARCFNCNGLGHFANICPSARRPRSSGPRLTPRSFAAAPFSREASYNQGGHPASAQANVLACNSSRQPAHLATHTADSRACIAELTASLKDTQVQLENSQARVAALLHRNMELTQDPQGHLPSPPSAVRSHSSGSSSLPDVRLLFCLLLTVTCFLSPGLAFDAWLCPSDGPTTLFLLRDHQNCSRLLPNLPTQPHRISLHLYRPNTQLYSSPASLCKIIRQSVTYSVSFFGARRERHTETHLTVSTEECKQMILHHRCPHGHMVEESGVWRTQNLLSFVFPSAPFGCCVDHSITVTNCYSYSTTVHSRHADKSPQTSVGDTSACSYKDGSCTLSDGSVLLWSPIQEEQCGYALVAKLSGSMMGPIWLSDDKEFALSWNEHSPVISDCTKELTVTDQGYAIQLSRRHARSSSGDVGVVTSNQLAAQLLAVEGSTYSSVSALFRNALRSLCERTNSMGSAVHSALRSHPTATMRTLLGRDDIAASYLGSGYVEVRRFPPRAVQRGTGNSPLLAIQAAFGTGKTLVGATIAARVSTPGQLVIATATTNVAVARFAESLLGLEEYRHRTTVLRFVADTALQEGTPTTPVDLHNVLKDLLVTHSDTLQPDEQERLERYAHGRRLIERVLFNPEATSSMTDEEKEEYRIAENQNSRATERAVKIMFRVRNPTILCITVSSLLNTTNPGGIFHESLFGCRTIIADEASQVPEPAFVALTAHFPTARQIYIGDVYQLQPHTRSSRSSLAARLGGKGVMDLLMAKDVPLAPLTTTFRAHPALNELPNTLVYGGTLSSGTSARHRTMLTERLTLPNSSLPLVVVNVEGHSRMSHTQSHSNEDEANCCIELVRALLAKNIAPGSIAIITFYKDQTRLLETQAARLGVRLHTVDSVQGHEMDTVIILTTRTHLDHASGEFLDDIRRMNVAMTRCRHGQFILGRVDALRSLTNWARLLRWAAARNVIIERSALPDLFS